MNLSKGEFWLGMWVGWMLFFIVMLVGSKIFPSVGYRDGQIDALNGKVKYELVKQADGTTDWVEKEMNDAN